MLFKMEQEEICGQQVYINELPVTPFATGLIHPRIVIPRIMKENFQTEELQIILLHERTHIHAGHLWFYAIWNMLWVILWPNLMFIVRFLPAPYDVSLCSTACACNIYPQHIRLCQTHNPAGQPASHNKEYPSIQRIRPMNPSHGEF